MSDSLPAVVAAVGVAGALLSGGGVVVSVLTSWRIWPPGDRDWRYWYTWGCWYPTTGALVVVGLLDAGSLGVVPPALRLAGGMLAVSGLVTAVAAIRGLGVRETAGVGGDLQTGGLYRYSRNPQYVGGVVAVAGWVAVTDSRLAVAVAVPYVAYYLLLPLAEEPWLAERYGDTYREYRSRVPRFIGWRTLRRLRGDWQSSGDDWNW